MHGRVEAVLKGRGGGRRPGPAQIFLTARPGRVGQALAELRRGDRIRVSVRPSGHRIVAGARHAPPVGRPSGLVGAGGTLLLGGHNRSGCGRRDEQLRPRSLLGWKRNGDVLVVAVSGRATVHGARFGGASVHQAAEFLRSLGAVRAVNFDGGGSTALFVRKAPGGKLLRLDRSGRAGQRPVVDALTFRVAARR